MLIPIEQYAFIRDFNIHIFTNHLHLYFLQSSLHSCNLLYVHKFPSPNRCICRSIRTSSNYYRRFCRIFSSNGATLILARIFLFLKLFLLILTIHPTNLLMVLSHFQTIVESLFLKTFSPSLSSLLYTYGVNNLLLPLLPLNLFTYVQLLTRSPRK